MAYGSDIGFQTWLDSHGYALPEGAPSLAVLRTRGSAYLDGTYEGIWTGHRTDGAAQADAWPRTGARIACTRAVPSDLVPVSVEYASYRAALLEGMNPGILAVSATSGQRVAREKVDVIEVAYHNDGGASAGSGSVAFIDGEIDGAMRVFVCGNAGGVFLRAVG